MIIYSLKRETSSLNNFSLLDGNIHKKPTLVNSPVSKPKSMDRLSSNSYIVNNSTSL